MLFVKQSLILSNRLQAVSKISLGLSLIVDHTHFLFVFHMCVLLTIWANIGKSRQYISREKTPKWLEERAHERQTPSEYDPQLEKEREAFLKQLIILKCFQSRKKLCFQT